MTVFETEIMINRLMIQYGKGVLEGIPNERMSEQPLPGVNHPAWILGHIIYTADIAASLLGDVKILDDAWKTRFGPGSKLTSNRADYPSKAELLGLLEERFEQVQRLAPEATPEQMAQPNPDPKRRDMLPTLQSIIAFLMTGHFGIHLGQLSAWRRMIGLPPLF